MTISRIQALLLALGLAIVGIAVARADRPADRIAEVLRAASVAASVQIPEPTAVNHD